MSTSYSYRKVFENLDSSLSGFGEVDALFVNKDGDNPENKDNLVLKERWRKVLTQGLEVAGFARNHHRAQSSPVLGALEEVAKYADVRRPFRLSVIGQKGVGKSALVNALLGASQVQYTPSEVAGKAVSGTRIRLIPATDAGAPWQVVFLTPARLWEIGAHLLNVARMPVPRPPLDLNNRAQVLAALKQALLEAGESGATGGAQIGSSTQIQAASARNTLAEIIRVYQAQSDLIPPDYRLALDQESVDGPVSSYIRQTADNLYLIVDYVERYLPAEEAGLLAGRKIELEDVLGLDDPRDSFFALEAFKESFAVVMVFKCDRGLNTESSSLLENLFSRDEEELVRFGSLADINKAIIVANQFDAVTTNVSQDSGTNPLKGIEDIRRDLSRYTRQPVPVFLTSAEMARNANSVLADPQARPSAAYSAYLPSLANLMAVVTGQGPVPDYLDFVLAKRAEIEASLDPAGLQPEEKARLVLDMSGLPRLLQKVEEALETGSILRGRVANAEYYYSRAIAETALCYARQMQLYKLELAELAQPPASQESRLFAKFQHEVRVQLEELDGDLKKSYFGLAQKYIHGPLPAEVEQCKKGFLETIRAAVVSNREFIRMQEHISTGETVTDAWRKVFEEINDWLVLEAGRQLRSLVGPLLADIEKLAGGMQQRLAQLAISPLDESFWNNYRTRLGHLRQRLQVEAEVLALGYFTNNRFSVYDLRIAEALHVGEAGHRREDVIKLLQERVLSWYHEMWHLLAKVAMTDLSDFIAETRHFVLGLPADGSLLVGLEIAGKSGQPSPEESLVAVLNYRYQSDEHYRRQYAMREPTPTERLQAEIRDWMGLVRPPLDSLQELSKAVAIAGVGRANESGDGSETGEAGEQAEEEVGKVAAESNPDTTTASSFSRLRVPVESRHPYLGLTKQVWEITNPDEKATHTRVHFSRVELTGPNDRIIVEALGRKQQQVITGQKADFWSEVMEGRSVVVRFQAEGNARPGWGFALDAVESASLETAGQKAAW